MTTPCTLHAIDPQLLGDVRASGRDVAGHPAEPRVSAGGEQLRCCLTRAEAGARLLLIGHAPLSAARPWREYGPVFVHADRCAGYDAACGVPAWFDDGDRVLRAYDPSGAMHYPANRVVPAGDGVATALDDIFDTFTPDAVAEVHVRNLLPQCFVARAVRA